MNQSPLMMKMKTNTNLHPYMLNATAGDEPTSIINRLSQVVHRKSNKEKKVKGTETTMKIQSLKTMIYLFVSAMIYSLYLLLIKVLIYHNNRNIPSISIMVFFLAFYQLTIALILMKIDHVDIASVKVFNKSEVDELIIRCIFEFLKNLFTLLSLIHMRLLSSVTVFFLSPIIRSYVVLKQKMDNLKKGDKICFGLGLIVCMIFLLQEYSEGIGEEEGDSMKGMMYSVIASIIIAFNNVAERKTCNEFHPYVIIMVTGIIGLSCAPIMMSWGCLEFKVGIGEFLLLVICGVSSVFAFYYAHKQRQMIMVSNRMTMNYTPIVMGYLFSIFVLDESVTVLDGIASVISVYVYYQTKMRLEICENEDDM